MTCGEFTALLVAFPARKGVSMMMESQPCLFGLPQWESLGHLERLPLRQVHKETAGEDAHEEMLGWHIVIGQQSHQIPAQLRPGILQEAHKLKYNSVALGA